MNNVTLYCLRNSAENLLMSFWPLKDCIASRHKSKTFANILKHWFSTFICCSPPYAHFETLCSFPATWSSQHG